MTIKLGLKLTTAGLAEFAAAITEERLVDISQMALGDANGAWYEITGNEVALLNEQARFPLLQIRRDPVNLNRIICDAPIPADVGGFVIREFGLLSAAGVLLAIGMHQVIDLPAPGGPVTLDIVIRGLLDVVNAEVVNLVVDPYVVTATRKYVDDALAEKQPLIAAGTEAQYFRGDKTWQNLPSGSFKNKIIGGDFSTNPWQRGETFTAVSGNWGYTADRFKPATSVPVPAAVVSVNRVVDAPTVEQAGILTRHCLQIDVTTADAAVAATDVFSIIQPIEGYNAAAFGFGHAGTRHVTLSFWVRSSKTGIHCVSLRNFELSRSYVAEYTVNAANTWEKKIITIPVDTAGNWLYDNGTGVYVTWALMCGANFHTIKDTWQGSVGGNGYVATLNQVNLMDNVAGDFRLALIQLEGGSVATPFESRDIGTELALCQRYCESYPPASIISTGAVPGANYAVVNCYTMMTPKRALGTIKPAVSYSFTNSTIGDIYIQTKDIIVATVQSTTQGSVSILNATQLNIDCEL